MELAIPLPTQAAAGPPPARLDEASDGYLLGRIAGRDAAAFELLYKRYARPVYGLALRLLGDRGRAEDAVQETFIDLALGVDLSARRGPARHGSTRSPATPSSTGSASERDPLAEHSRRTPGEPGPPEQPEQSGPFVAGPPRTGRAAGATSAR